MSDTATPATQAIPAAEAVPQHMIPKARFDEVNEAKKAAEAQLAAYAAKEEAARQEQLQKAGDFETLKAELTTKLTAAEERAAALATKAAEYEAQQAAIREAQIATLPEAHREIVKDLPADKLAAYVALHSGKPGAGYKPNPPGVTAKTAKASAQEIAENISKPGWLAENFGRL